MTQQHSMNTIIHAALRRDLDRFERALSTSPSAPTPHADKLVPAWQNFYAQLRQHHDDEETIFFPAFRELGVDEALMSGLDSEHVRMVSALEAANAAMQALAADTSVGTVDKAHAAVIELRDVVRAHLEHEERDLEPFAARHVASPQLKHARAAVRKAHKRSLGTFFAWLQDDADHASAAGLRNEIPPPVLLVITRLGGRRYRREVATAWT
jgi:hemerythrin-like domain-containing protein